MAIAKLTTYRNDAWLDWYYIFKELFLAAFTYDNLPPEINSRYLEMVLFETGMAAFFRDDVMEKHIVTRCVPNGRLNVYDEPTGIDCIGGGGGLYRKHRKNGVDSVVIFNSFTRYNPSARLESYAKRIAEIENTIDININAQKTPYILSGSRKNQTTLKTILNQIGSYQPAIIVDESIGDDAIKVFTTTAPYVVDKLEEQKRKLYNEALSYIGIDNNASEKSERLLVDEIMVSNGFAIANRNARLQMRKAAVSKINALFGLNIEVKFNNPSFYNSPYDERRQMMQEGEDENDG